MLIIIYSNGLSGYKSLLEIVHIGYITFVHYHHQFVCGKYDRLDMFNLHWMYFNASRVFSFLLAFCSIQKRPNSESFGMLAMPPRHKHIQIDSFAWTIWPKWSELGDNIFTIFMAINNSSRLVFEAIEIWSSRRLAWTPWSAIWWLEMG